MGLGRAVKVSQRIVLPLFPNGIYPLVGGQIWRCGMPAYQGTFNCFVIYPFVDRFDRGSRQSVCYMVVFAFNISNIGGEFGGVHVGKVSLLSAGLKVQYV